MVLVSTTNYVGDPFVISASKRLPLGLLITRIGAATLT